MPRRSNMNGRQTGDPAKRAPGSSVLRRAGGG